MAALKVESSDVTRAALLAVLMDFVLAVMMVAHLADMWDCVLVASKDTLMAVRSVANLVTTTAGCSADTLAGTTAGLWADMSVAQTGDLWVAASVARMVVRSVVLLAVLMGG